MTKNVYDYQYYLSVLKEELVSATGCTEPVAIAYATAKAIEVLEANPDRILVEACQGIIKNAKSVVVPNTGGLRGLVAAVSAGAVSGQVEKGLDVISEIGLEDIIKIRNFTDTCKITIKTLSTEFLFDFQVTVYKNQEMARVRIINHHTNIVLIEKNDQVLFNKPYINSKDTFSDDHTSLTIENIVKFADEVKIDDVRDLLDHQIQNNSAIAQEGINNAYGANIGSTLLNHYGNDIKNRAKALTAAASDARMGGCKLPVTIVSGSGNQGLTASIPVIEYAKELNVSQEELYRALVISNLVTIRLKSDIGSISAFCGAVFAGTACGAGIAYLHHGDFVTIAHTIVNSLAIVSGMICDGAKASCAAKIAVSVDAGILGYQMFLDGQEFLAGDGIIAKGVENTIKNITRLIKDGMKGTEDEIVKIMIENC